MITTGGQPILMDFGIAKLITADTSLTRTGASIGTPAYMAPEQALGTADICPATDIYALSIVLYELLTGSVPFKADTPVGIVMKTLSEPLPKPQLVCPDIGDELQEVLVKGTAKSLADRYNSISDFRIALNAAVVQDGSTAANADRKTTAFANANRGSVAPTRERPQRQEKHSTAMAVAVAAVTVAITAGTGYWWMKQQQKLPEKVSEQQVSPPPVSPAPVAAERIVASKEVATATPIAVSKGDSAATTQPVETTPAPPAIAKADVPATKVPKSDPGPTPQAPGPSVPAEQVAATPAPQSLPKAQLLPLAPAASSGPLTEVVKGKTTQSDLLRLFGGPNLTTYDEAGLETWIYERTSTQTDTISSERSTQGSASLGLFFKSVSAGVSGEKSSASGAVTTSSTVRSVTVIVKFSADRTVYDYSVKETYF